MGQDVIACSAVCNLAIHAQAAAETILYLCVSERNRLMRVRRRLSLTHAELGKLIPGDVWLTSLLNIWSREVFFRHSMLHLYSAYRVTVVPDRARLFSSSSTNGCHDLSGHSRPQSENRSLSYKRCSGS